MSEAEAMPMTPLRISLFSRTVRKQVPSTKTWESRRSSVCIERNVDLPRPSRLFLLSPMSELLLEAKFTEGVVHAAPFTESIQLGNSSDDTCHDC